MNLYELQQKIYEEINKNEEEGFDEYLEGRTNGLNFALDLVETLIAEAEKQKAHSEKASEKHKALGQGYAQQYYDGRLDQLTLTLGEKPE